MRTNIWKIGPYHSLLREPFLIQCHLKGDIITSASFETGFIHKSFERLVQAKTWRAAIPCLDHLDPYNAAFYELVFCLAVEDIAEIYVPPRAMYIRHITCELSRISSHLFFLIQIAQALHLSTIQQYFLRDQERILSIFELLTGMRFSFHFFTLGGVRADITDGCSERIFELCELLILRFAEYKDLLNNPILLGRSKDIGILDIALCKRFNISGPNARASGLKKDLRKDAPYNGSEAFQYKPFLDSLHADVYSRFILRIHEIFESIDLLKQLLNRLPHGPYFNDTIGLYEEVMVPAGETFLRVESSRGNVGCHIISDGQKTPRHISFRSPSIESICVLPHVLEQTSVEDLSMILRSFDLNLSEVDR